MAPLLKLEIKPTIWKGIGELLDSIHAFVATIGYFNRIYRVHRLGIYLNAREHRHSGCCASKIICKLFIIYADRFIIHICVM